MRGEELSLSDGICAHGLCLHWASPGNAAAPHQQQQRPATGPCSAAGAGAAVSAVSWSLPRAEPGCRKNPRRGFQQPGLRLPRAFSASRAEPSRAGCGRLPAPLPRLPAGGEGGKLREGGQRAGPMPVSSRPALSAASFRGHLSSRNEPPAALPGPRPRTAGTRGGAATAAAVGAGPARSGCPQRGPSLHPVPVSPVLPLTPPASKSDLG